MSNLSVVPNVHGQIFSICGYCLETKRLAIPHGSLHISDLCAYTAKVK